MSFFIKKIYLFILLLFITPFVFSKDSRIKSIREAKSFSQNKGSSDIINKEEKKIIVKSNKDYKYVVFDVSNCFWQKSLYDLLMSLKKNN
ncbi:MAG: hypothetical protein ABIF12_01000 [bacterium]